jgi:hypothetical protein
MGGTVPGDPISKGAACKCLDVLPAHPAKMTALQTALVGIAASGYTGLETVLGTHLLPLIYNPSDTAKVVQQLKRYWFDPASPDCFFPGIKVAETYCRGLIRTLSLSMATTPPLRIDAYWVLDHAEFDMLNLKSARQVTLLIATPRPSGAGAGGAGISGSFATEMWSTRAAGGRVEERRI